MWSIDSTQIHTLRLQSVVVVGIAAATLWLATTTRSVAGSLFVPLAGTGVSLDVTSLQEERYRSTIRQKYDFSCGSAALSTLLTHHYDHPLDETTIFRSMYTLGDREKIRKDGFSLLDMKRFLNSVGYKADGFRVPLEKLQQVRVPAIALINDEGFMHFVIVKGVRDGRVLLADPAKGTRALDTHRFEKMWNGIFFVIRDDIQTARQHFDVDEDWQACRKAPLGEGVLQPSLSNFTLLLPARNDY